MTRQDADPAACDGRRGASKLRQLLHSAIPSHFEDPFGLTMRLIRTKNPDAISALTSAVIKLGLMPVDHAMAALGRMSGREPVEPALPILFVTGPPRSGTTLLHQTLIRALPVAYITNLATLLPRSSHTSPRLLGAAIANGDVRLESYYGRTRSLSGPSDGLELWDQWLGADRRAIAERIDGAAAAKMRHFFGQLEQRTGRPAVAKNNNLLGSAHLVANVLPTARFVCLRREPLFLAQSLLMARRAIHGSATVSYGIDDLASEREAKLDPVDDVFRQISFYNKLEASLAKALGPQRFRVVSYEALCENPTTVVEDIGRTLLGLDCTAKELPSLRLSRRRTLPADEFERLERRCSELGFRPADAPEVEGGTAGPSVPPPPCP